MTHRCHIDLLGRLRIVRGGREISRFPTRKTAALLAYLALHLDRAHPREVLVELFWPDVAPQAGRHSLSQALSCLRRLAEPPGVPTGTAIVADRASVQLNPDTVTTDAIRFERRMAAADQAESAGERLARLEAAAGEYAGELLPGFYAEWVQAERRRLAGMYIEALERLSRGLADQGEAARALDFALRAVEVEPLWEALHRRVMSLYARTGAVARAVAHYEVLVEALDEELGIAPAPATRALVRDLREREPGRGGPADESEQPSSIPGVDSAGLPTGTVTVLVVDVERMTPEGPDRAKRRAALRNVVERHGGFAVGATAGCLGVVFGRASDALVAALEGRAAWRDVGSGGAASAMRLALHTGEVGARTVQGRMWDRGRAARLLARGRRLLLAGRGGQIMCSAETASLLRRNLPLGLQLTDLGRKRLAPGTRSERVFRVLELKPVGGGPPS